MCLPAATAAKNGARALMANDRVPFRRRHRVERRPLHDRRGIHQHVERAKRRRDRIDERAGRRPADSGRA